MISVPPRGVSATVADRRPSVVTGGFAATRMRLAPTDITFWIKNGHLLRVPHLSMRNLRVAEAFKTWAAS
jgi:hypothetical protein